MKLNRQAIQRMIDTGGVNIGGRRTAGGGGAGGGGGVSSAWVDENYVSKEFFARLFTINGVDEDDNDVVVEPNDMDTDITNIQAMVGLWTEEYLSALGIGSGGGGGSTILTEPLASINESGIGLPLSADQVIVWNGSAWAYRPYTTGSGTVTSIKITVPTGFTVNPSQAITTDGTFVIGFDTGYSLPTDVKQGQWDDAAAWVNTNAAATVSKTAWGRTYWNAGVPQNINGNIESTGHITPETGGYYEIGTEPSSNDAGLRYKAIHVEEVWINGIKVTADANGVHVVNNGLYADTHVSALGAGSGGGGGASLTEPLASINESGIGLPLSADQVIVWNGSAWVYRPYTTGSGTVTSIRITVPTGFTVNPSTAITTSGTFVIGFDTGYSLPTDVKQGQWDDAYSWVSTNGISTATFTAWGRTYWNQGAPQSISGDIENAAHIKIDNDKRISWKRANSSSYLSLITLDSNEDFVVGESMASSGLTTFLRGRTVTLQSGSGISGNHAASIDNTGLFTVEKLKIGNIVISEDTTNGGLHVESAGIYADTYVSALGAGSGGGGGTGITINDVWTAMAASAPSGSTEQIHVSHLSQALVDYVTTTRMNMAVASAIASVTKLLTIRNGDGTVTYGTYDGKTAVNIDIPSGGSYTLPAATSGALGGIKIGYTESGKNYAVQLSNEKAYVNVPWENDDTKNTAGATNLASTKLFLIGAIAPNTNPVTNSNINCFIGTDNCLYSNGAKVLTDGSVFPIGGRGTFNLNTIYDAGFYMIAGGSNVPSGDNYGVLLSLPYRQASGNTSPDFGVQIFIPNGDDGSYPNGLFYRTSEASWNAWQRVVTADTNGNVGIGANSSSSYKLNVNGTTYLGGNTTVNGTVTAGSCIEIGGTESVSSVSCATVKTLSRKGIYIKTGSSPNWIDGTWNNTSDIRKKDVVDYVDADLEMIAKVRIFNFRWKADSKSQTMLGTAAQDWQKIFPNAVKDGPDGYLSMDYSATALAAAVITARNAVNHEKEIARLKKRIEDLEKQLAS